MTVTDANNCVLIVPFTINGYTCNLTGAATVTNVSCNGANDGSAVYNITNGNGNYTYAWSNGDTSSGITNLDGGSYSLVITDIFNCTFLDTIIINEPDTIETTFVIISDTSSMGVGSAIPTITGGTAPYTLTWSNGTSTNLTQGTYFLTVTDNSNCANIFSFYIDNIVGTRQLLNENQIEIYPNPADDFINIRLNLDKNYPIQLKIFSTDGRLMLHQNAASSLSNNLKISTADLPKGIYVLQLIINNQFITKRLIIQ